jgi:two-component system, chemotaxis family, chemotaxis protein CheY
MSTVLVVEDERLIREVLSELLRDAGYEVAHAENGCVALALLETRPVDVILLDLMMPVMDGFAFRARQLEHPGLAHIPVIVLSASFDVAAQLGLLSPASYMCKPFDVSVVLQAVEAVCHRPA